MTVCSILVARQTLKGPWRHKVTALNPTPYLQYPTAILSCHSPLWINKQVKTVAATFPLKAAVDCCRCFKSPPEAQRLCVFTKVYHSSSTDLRPLISSLCSQTHNDPHLSGNAQLVSDTQSTKKERALRLPGGHFVWHPPSMSWWGRYN